jgi:hypothetical protein
LVFRIQEQAAAANLPVIGRWWRYARGDETRTVTRSGGVSVSPLVERSAGFVATDVMAEMDCAKLARGYWAPGRVGVATKVA